MAYYVAEKDKLKPLIDELVAEAEFDIQDNLGHVHILLDRINNREHRVQVLEMEYVLPETTKVRRNEIINGKKYTGEIPALWTEIDEFEAQIEEFHNKNIEHKKFIEEARR
jgi:hypothetical protein